MATLSKRGQGKPGGSVAAMGILILLMIGILFYVIGVPPAEKEQLLYGSSYTTESLLLSKSNIILKGSTDEETTTYTHYLQDIFVNYAPQESTKLISSEFTINRNLISDNPKSFIFNFSKADIVGMYISATVKDTIGGNLGIYMNGKEISVSSPSKNEIIKVQVPLEYLIEGQNKLDFSMTLSFFTKSYTLSNVNFITSKYEASDAVKTQLLILDSDDLEDMESATLSAMLKQISENPAAVTLEINDKEVINATLPEALELDVSSYIKQGTNTFKWTVEKGGAYQIKFGNVEIESTKISSEAKKYSFAVSQSDMSKITQRHYLDCELYMQQKSGTDNIKIRLNSYNLERSFSGGVISENICGYLIVGSNSITLSAEDDLEIERLTIKVS